MKQPPKLAQKCTCGEEEYDLHPCPYEEDVHDDYSDQCTCCPVCTIECAEDI